MKIVATADWHGNLPNEELLGRGDVLVIAGDTLPVWNHSLGFQSDWIDRDLIPHLAGLYFDEILIIGGNHDFLLETKDDWWERLPDNVHYLQDAEFAHEGIKFWGSPWSGRYGPWAFMAEDDVLAGIYSMIPTDVNVLITHGPPRGAGDLTMGGVSAGSPSLRTWIEEHQPAVVVTGHIHEDYGLSKIDNTKVFNVAYVDLGYSPSNKPQVIYL